MQSKIQRLRIKSMLSIFVPHKANLDSCMGDEKSQWLTNVMS